jgi:hypothetical protein
VVPPDRFAVRAETILDIPPGEYILEVESDDGIRIWLNDQMILDRWDIHTPTIDEKKLVVTSGSNRMRVDYFEGGGLGVLDVMIRQ